MRKISILAIFLLLWAGTVFAEQFPFVGKVEKEGVNVRSGPNINFESLYKTRKQENVIVVAKLYDWYKIMLPMEVVCFISAKYVESYKEGSTSSEERVAEVRGGMVTANRVNVRAGPGDNYTIMGQVNKGQVLSIVEQRDGWFAIKPLDNCYGWIHQDFVKFFSTFSPEANETPNPKEEEAVKPVTALKLPEPTPAVNKEALFEAVGIIEPRGKVVGRRGTHKLMINGKTAYYLEGEPLVLNNYLHYQVKISGEKKTVPTSDLPVIVVKRIIAE